ncbi:MAG: ATP-dependent 6-phosphofructokinase [Acidobacteriia bacterium]|nr:ATP-dependent 6-phosphofructokinase [Terriglobia bacterium]
MKTRRVGILTGGGDCPGLNAAIKWIVYGAICHSAHDRKNPIEVLALKEGWAGILALDPKRGIKDARYVQMLTPPVVRKIDRDGGTAIGTSRTNPFSMSDKKGKKHDKSATVVRNMEILGLDALIVIGGEDTLGVANKLYERYGVPVVGIPKTIDLDLPGTEYSLGFDSAVNNIKVLVDRARTVAGSHRKTAVIEVMGRHSGLLALAGGIVSSAHFILIPEYSFELSKLIALINERTRSRSRYTLVVVAEGAKERGGRIVAQRRETDAFGHVHLGGIGEILADQITARTGLETIAEKLGYLQRGGDPSAFDAKMGYYFGITAVDMFVRKDYGKMVSVQHGTITPAPLSILNQPVRVVNVDLMYDKGRLNARRDTALNWVVN